MKTLVGALIAGAALIAVSAFMQAADARHLQQPKHNNPERLRMIRDCMEMHNKHRGDMPFHSGGREFMYHACVTKHGHHG